MAGPCEGPKSNDRRPSGELEDACGLSPSNLAERGHGRPAPSELWAQHSMEKSAEQRLLVSRHGNGNALQRGSPLMMIMMPVALFDGRLKSIGVAWFIMRN